MSIWFHSNCHTYRIPNTKAVWCLDPGAFCLLAYLYQQLADEKTNPLQLPSYDCPLLGTRAQSKASKQLIQAGLLSNEGGQLTLLMDGEPVHLPERRHKFPFSTSRILWAVINKTILSPSAFKVYACLCRQGAERIYLTDTEIASAIGLSPRQVGRQIQLLNRLRLIVSTIRGQKSRYNRDSVNLRRRFTNPKTTRIRVVWLCDPLFPGQTLTPRNFSEGSAAYMFLKELRSNDVQDILSAVGVEFTKQQNPEQIECYAGGWPHRVYTETGVWFSKDQGGAKIKGKRVQHKGAFPELLRIALGAPLAVKVMAEWRSKLSDRNCRRELEEKYQKSTGQDLSEHTPATTDNPTVVEF